MSVKFLFTLFAGEVTSSQHIQRQSAMFLLPFIRGHKDKAFSSSKGKKAYLNQSNDRNKALIDNLMKTKTFKSSEKSIEQDNWDKLNRAFEVEDDTMESYVRYRKIMLLLKDQNVATRFIDYLLSMEHIEEKMAVIFKELISESLEKVMHKSVMERDINQCRLIHKLLIGQKQLGLAKHFLQTIISENRILKDCECVIIKRMLCDMLEKLIFTGAFENYFDIHKTFTGNIDNQDIGLLLFKQLKREVISLDIYMELLLDEHYILTERESSFVQTLCDRNTDFSCTAVTVNIHRGLCTNCNFQLKKDRVTQSEFNTAFEDFTLKLSESYVESTLYFNSLQDFIRDKGPFDYFIDMANVSSGNAPNQQILKTIKCLPKDKKICVIKSEKCGTLKFPSNVTIFNIHSYAFKGQDDILLLLGILLNGPDTILISNDSYRDHFCLLRNDVKDIMLRWQRTCQQPFLFNENNDVELFPKLFSRTAQRSTKGWHIPYLSDEMSNHDAAFLCIQVQDWTLSKNITNIWKAKLKLSA